MMNGRLEIVESFDQVVTDEGFSPREDGRPLNLGFERASLQDWKATGNAFTAKSVAFDPDPFYPDSMELKQSGDYYVTSGGTSNYAATGTLTSATFEITRTEEHTSELQSLMRNSYAVFCLKQKTEQPTN